MPTGSPVERELFVPIMAVHTSNASNARAGWPSRLRAQLQWDWTVESALWAVAVLAMLLDVGLTGYGLTVGMSEVNPVGRLAIAAFGPAGLLLAKLPVIGLAAVGWRVLADTERWVVPFGLMVPWGTAAVLNLSLIVSAF